MSFSRKLARANRSPAEKKPHPGIDTKQLKITDIESISLDTGDDLVTVTFLVPVGEGEAMAEFELAFDVDEFPTLSTAATALSRALLELVKLPQPEESPCATCTGVCCGRHFESVRVTKADIERMERAGLDCSSGVIKRYHAELFSGYVGEFVQVAYDGPDAAEGETCCPYLTREGCSIYEHRPTVCRDYSAWTCDLYVEDEEKKRRLPVVPA